MTNTTKLKNTPKPPLELFKQVFCKNCQNQCNPTEIRFQNCIFALIADELTKMRQLEQHRRNLNW